MRAVSVSSARPRKTIDDLRALPEDVRAELIDGDIYVTPAPHEPHQTAAARITWALVDHERRGGAGRVFPAPFDVHLPVTGDVVQPDLVWISNANLGILRGAVHGAPDLLVEILSPYGGDRDRIVKHRLYAKNGVREYWIVDPAAKEVEVFVLEGDAYRAAGWFTPGTCLVSPSLPGFSMPVDEVFPPSPSAPHDAPSA